MNEAGSKDIPGKTRTWTRRAGIVAFIFFLGKGLLWLGLAAVGAYYSFN
jgi:hypothetical protein